MVRVLVSAILDSGGVGEHRLGSPCQSRVEAPHVLNCDSSGEAEAEAEAESESLFIVQSCGKDQSGAIRRLAIGTFKPPILESETVLEDRF